MSSYITTVVEEAVQKGRKEGIRKGIEEGIRKGFEEGIEKGFEEGIEKGIEEGIEKGIRKGIEEGIEKGKLEMANNLLTQGLLSDEQIAAVSGLPLARIQALRNPQQH